MAARIWETARMYAKRDPKETSAGAEERRKSIASRVIGLEVLLGGKVRNVKQIEGAYEALMDWETAEGLVRVTLTSYSPKWAKVLRDDSVSVRAIVRTLRAADLGDAGLTIRLGLEEKSDGSSEFVPDGPS
jgi:hypothetical protein